MIRKMKNFTLVMVEILVVAGIAAVFLALDSVMPVLDSAFAQQDVTNQGNCGQANVFDNDACGNSQNQAGQGNTQDNRIANQITIAINGVLQIK
jgi:flagellar hook-length control protein FliK